MRGATFNLVGMIAATGFGVGIAYTSLQPKFEEELQARKGTFADQHRVKKDQDTAISQAIISDLKEAKGELTKTGDHGGFAWGIRQMLFGGPSPRQHQDRTPQLGKEHGQPRAEWGKETNGHPREPSDL